MCFKVNAFEYFSSQRRPFKLPAWLVRFFISKPTFWILGGMSGMSLFIEAQRRRGELAMYVLPKALESYWHVTLGTLGVRKNIFRGGESVVRVLLRPAWTCN